MGRRRRQERDPLRWVIAGFALALALVLVAAGALLLPRVLADPEVRAQPSPAPSPSPTPEPSPVLLPGNSAGRVPTAAGLAAVLAGPLADRRLGGRLSYTVVDVRTGAALAGASPARLVAPASVAKVITAAAVLAAMGPAARIPTRVVAGTAPGDVVLVGGGDPTLSVGAVQSYPGAARLDILATAVRKAYGAPVRRVIVDGAAFPGATTGPGWDSDVVSGGFVAPITAVMVDGGRVNPRRAQRSLAPDLFAGQAFARLVGAPAAAVTRGTAPATGRELARVTSAPIATIVEQMLAPSDNVLAEALIRQVAIAGRVPADFAGSIAAVRAILTRIGLDVTGLRLSDGSGLSRLNMLSPATVTSLLVAAAGDSHPQLRPLLAGLPVAGFSGTLDNRFRTASQRPAAGQVRAKTGSLSGVSTLAGVVRDIDGRLLAFAVLADRVPPGGIVSAEVALDRIAASLARCGCG